MTATLDIRAPTDQTEGTRSQVLRWLKAVGETVAEHEPLIEIETDKVTVEIASPASGVLSEIVKAEQEEITPGEVLGRLETSASLSRDPSGVHVATSTNEPTASAARAAPVATATTAMSAQGTASAAASKAAPSLGAPAPTRAPRITPDTPVRFSPAVRRLLSERNLDPSSIRGSGEGGRITIDDVLAHHPPGTFKSSTAADSDATPDPRGKPSAPPITPGRTRSIPHSAIRKRTADHMVHSLLETAPHVTTVFEADLSALIAHRSAHRADFEARGAPLTFTAYFLSATVNAIHAVPEANSRWTDSALEIYDDIHIGIATAVAGTGLIVPVLRNVQALDLFGIAQRLNQLVTAAREGTLAPADVRGGTFTISNHGVSGSLLAAPIVIHQPQSAILGIGKLEKRPVVVENGGEERIVVRPKCYVTLTIDHRVMDGHQANRLLQTFVRTLEAWPPDSQ
jgi:2-oxoglutarate dehydrogenase E2 component (dihydrolipoamide succinyltransferase)